MEAFTFSNTVALKSGQGLVRRTALLPAQKFSHGGRVIDVQPDDLEAMAENLRSGAMGPERMVTLAHPDDADLAATPAVGWIIAATAKVETHDGKAVLMADIRWLDQMAADIDAEKYKYISPVFTNSYTDQSGAQLGWGLLFAGVTNTPHWTDQPGLLARFARQFFAKNKPEDTTMDEKEMIIKLTAQINDQTVAFAATKAELATAKAEADAAQKRIAALEQNEKVSRGQALIMKFQASGHLQAKHLSGSDGKPTALVALAVSDPVLFADVVNTFTPVVLATAPIGANGDAADEGKTLAEKACAITTAFCVANPTVKYFQVADLGMKAAEQGKSLAIVGGKPVLQ
jgi:hypothetical protein